MPLRQILAIVVPVLAMGHTLPQAPAPATPRGPFVADMDRTADACTDFLQFANGGWRAANPIPASMPRWSRRWEAGEPPRSSSR